MRKWTVEISLIEAAVATTLAIAIAGCGARAHLTPTHGRSGSQAFRAQMLHPNAGKSSHPEQGLDSQAAAIVADNYHRSLAPEGQGSTKSETQILYVEPQK